jgi:hypothetical protein
MPPLLNKAPSVERGPPWNVNPCNVNPCNVNPWNVNPWNVNPWDINRLTLPLARTGSGLQPRQTHHDGLPVSDGQLAAGENSAPLVQ